jgi:hypothetical protein
MEARAAAFGPAFLLLALLAALALPLAFRMRPRAASAVRPGADVP